ncbi:MAG: CDGSH iron-sulfur domain-containing protein [Candidatus Limnocylindrales bacterium]
MSEPATLPEVTVTPRDNGPYRVAGPVVLLDADGGRWVVPEGRPVFLCRCGQSGTKPFCDGSHGRVGFESRVRAPQADPVEG